MCKGGYGHDRGWGRRTQTCFVSKFISIELVDIGILCILGVDEKKYFVYGGKGKHHAAVPSLKLA